MEKSDFLRLLGTGPVIPAARTFDDFKYALEQTQAESIFVLFGDILVLPQLLQLSLQHKKRLVAHLDLLQGIGKDEAGIRFLARMGIKAIITTKSHLGKVAREEGMIVIQRLFVMDSEALKQGLHLLTKARPDAVEVLPASVPDFVVKELIKKTGLPILAGGLVTLPEDITAATNKGICAVSTSCRALWQ